MKKCLLPFLLLSSFQSLRAEYNFHDSHFHLTNYIQEGTPIQKYVEIMGDTVGRSTVFGIPLQQQWSQRISGDHAPKYYLDTDARLYYYSFTDAFIAMAYKSLPKESQDRLDPMITGFNPTDMYGVDHIRRVLQTFPGVFSGIGEFTIHKEFVSSKVAGDVASLTDPALDRILDFAGDVGLVVLIHSDFNTPFPKDGSEPHFFKQMKDLLYRHPKTKIIWAHIGLGRVIQPIEGQMVGIRKIIEDKKLKHVSFDISWDEVAKYVLATPDTVKRVAEFINKHPHRFLFGTDEVAPADVASHEKVYYQYGPLWNLLTKEANDKVKKLNYEKLFDEARVKVRAWEKKQGFVDTSVRQPAGK